MRKIRHALRLILSFCLTVFILNCWQTKVKSSRLSGEFSNGFHNAKGVSDASTNPTSDESVVGRQDFNHAENQEMTNENNNAEKATDHSLNSNNGVTTIGMECNLLKLMPDMGNKKSTAIAKPSQQVLMVTTGVERQKATTTFSTPHTETVELIQRDDEEHDINKQQDLRSKIIENLPMVCPTGRVCRRTLLQDTKPGYMPCCGGYFLFF